jgi:hypothetical protein
MKNQFENAFEVLNYLRDISKVNKLSEREKTALKVHYLQKKSQNSNPSYFSFFKAKYLNFSVNLWNLWFVVSYIFYGVLYLIPEIVGKNLQNINFDDLVNAVIYSTIYEIIGILSTFIMEFSLIGRLGSFKISFIGSTILSLLCLIFSSKIGYFLQFLKGTIQIANRALYTYTTESYPTEIRGLALGLSNVFTRIAGLSTPIINELLMSITPKFAFLALTAASILGCISSFMLKKETLNLHLDS